MEKIRVGFALTGSFCTLEKAITAMEETAARYPNILPILSETTAGTDTRFGRAFPPKYIRRSKRAARKKRAWLSVFLLHGFPP